MGIGGRVVNQNVQSTEGFFNVFKQIIYLIQMAGMAGHGFSMTTLMLNFIFNCLQTVQLAADQNTAGPIFCQR